MKTSDTSILLTGGTGFLGHHLANVLQGEGARVTLLVQPHETTWRLSRIMGDVNIVRADLADAKETGRAVKSVRPDIVCHFAGRMERRRDPEILDDLIEHHLIRTMNLAKALEPETTKLFINTGTSEEYGELNDPFSEQSPIDPVSPYSASKAAATAVVTYLSKALGIPAVTMRPFIVYGPGQVHDTLIPFLIRGVLKKQSVELSEGSQFRDFLYVDDLTACYLAAIQRSEIFKRPEIFNVGSGRVTTVREVIDTLADLLNGHKYLKPGTRPMRAGEPPSMVADIRKTVSMLGWKPQNDLKAGLEKTVQWWLANEELWK